MVKTTGIIVYQKRSVSQEVGSKWSLLGRQNLSYSGVFVVHGSPNCVLRQLQSVENHCFLWFNVYKNTACCIFVCAFRVVKF